MQTEKIFNVIMVPELHREFKTAAAREGLTMNELALDAIDRRLDELAQRNQASTDRFKAILAKRTPQDNEALRRLNEKIDADPAIQEIERQAAEHKRKNEDELPEENLPADDLDPGDEYKKAADLHQLKERSKIYANLQIKGKRITADF